MVCVTARVQYTRACGMRESRVTAVDSCGCGRQFVSNTTDGKDRRLELVRAEIKNVFTNARRCIDHRISLVH